MMASKNKIAVVTLSFNAKKTTDKLIRLLKKQKNAAKFDIIVVDNGSTDGTYEYLTSKYKDLIVLKTKENYGCSGGNCIGMMYAYDQGYDYIILTDNDAYPVSGDLVWTLVKNVDKKKVTYPSWKENNNSKDDEISLPFHYLCFNRETITTIGTPFFYYFLFYDDAEYIRRIRKHNISLIKLPVQYSHPKVVAVMPMQRFYFYLRNQFLYYLRNDSFLKYLIKSIFALNIIIIYLLYFKQKNLSKCGFLAFKDFLIWFTRRDIKTDCEVEFKQENTKEFKNNNSLVGLGLCKSSLALLKMKNNKVFNLDKNVMSILPFIAFLITNCTKKNLVCSTFHSHQCVFASLFFKNVYFLNLEKSSKIKLFIFRIKNNNRVLKLLLLILANMTFFVPLVVILSLRAIFGKKLKQIKNYSNYIVAKSEARYCQDVNTILINCKS